MKVPYSWLKEYVNIDLTPQELAEKLVEAGLEVEEIIDVGAQIKNVVTGKILGISKHSNADKLQVCTLDTQKEVLTIVTGATNVNIGDVVPVAINGAELPGGKKIATTLFRGVTSYGMLCGGSELGADNTVIENAEVDGILILPPDTELGIDIKDVLGFNEFILDVSITSNRPDCQSIIGIAREVAAIVGAKVKMPSLKYKFYEEDVSNYLSVSVEAPDLCPNYYSAVVKNIKIETSPKWMRDRLRFAGIRPINNIVDITNYVLVEVGQPMHAFDLRDIGGNKIVVRRALDGEQLTTLDGKTHTLKSSMLVIADGARAIGLAGIMGGLNSEIKSDTPSIAFEAAKFDRASVRVTSRSLGIQSAASARFEKGIDAGTSDFGLERALSLVSQLKAGKIVEQHIKIDQEPVKCRKIKVAMDSVNKLLGIKVPVKTAVKLLNGLDIETTANASDVLTCVVPLYRDDIENYTDVAEEIIRMYGYDKIIGTLPQIVTFSQKTEEMLRSEKTKETLARLGCFETITYSFINKKAFDLLALSPEDVRRKAMRLQNPVSEEYATMRTTMAHNATISGALNLNRKNFDFRLFEISRVYLPKAFPIEESPLEAERLTLTVAGKEESFFTVKALLEETAADFGKTLVYTAGTENYLHPGKSADVYMSGDRIGCFGAVHPAVCQNYGFDQELFIAEIDYLALSAAGGEPVKYLSLPKYQEIDRDIAITVADEVKAGDLLACIKNAAGELLESVDVFDVYKGSQIASGSKSIAFQLRFRSKERTLVDTEVAAVMNGVENALSKQYGAKLRK